MQEFRTLRVWQAAHAMRCDVYRRTAAFPASEAFGLTSQARRAASAVAANIAEGCGRGTAADMHRFLQIAFGSLLETLDHLLLARDVNLLSAADFAALEAQLEVIRPMLLRLMQRVRTSRHRTQR